MILEAIRRKVGPQAVIAASVDRICPTLTPGGADLHSLNYRKLPRYFYPFSLLDDYRITDIIPGRTGRAGGSV